MKFCIRCFKEVFNVLLLKATLSLDFFLRYAILLLDIQICVLLPPSKTKSITSHNLSTMAGSTEFRFMMEMFYFDKHLVE